MTKVRSIQAAVCLIFALSAFSAIPLSAEEKTLIEVTLGKSVDKETLEIEKKFDLLLPLKTAIDVLKIKPGMTILDVGAGIGRFTFPIADALEGSGAVYATEVMPNLVGYIEKKASADGYKNVFPVLVDGSGNDDIYKKKVFDIIFVCGVLYHIRSIEDTFGTLKQSLSPNGGRLFIIHAAPFSPFNDLNFGDFKPIIKALKKEGEDFPVFKLLDTELQKFIRDYHGEDIPPHIKDLLVDNFNKMLSERSFFYDMVDYFRAKNGPAANRLPWPYYLTNKLDNSYNKYVKLLFEYLDEAGVLDKGEKLLTAQEKDFLQQFNKTLLIGIFSIDPAMFKRAILAIPLMPRSKKSVISKIEALGFRLVEDHDIFREHFCLEFERKE